MRFGFIAVSALVTIACVIYVVIAARAPVVTPPVEPARAASAPVEPAPAPRPAAPPTPARPTAAPAAPPAPNGAPAVETRTAGELTERALERFDDGDLDGARELAERCVALDRGRTTCQALIAKSYAFRGQYAEGHAHFVQCLKDDPGNEFCMQAMTSYHLQRGDRDEAKRMLDTLTYVHRDSVPAHVAAAEYARAVNDHDGECAHYKAACDLGQQFACQRWQGACRARHEE